MVQKRQKVDNSLMFVAVISIISMLFIMMLGNEDFSVGESVPVPNQSPQLVQYSGYTADGSDGISFGFVPDLQ